MNWSHGPRLTQAMDANLVGTAVAAALGDPAAVEKAQVADVRYRPGRPCWLLYRFKMRRADGRAEWQMFAGRLPGVSAEVPDPPADLIERYRSSEMSRVEPPVIRLPDLDLVLYAFPLDEALPTLADALDPAVVRRELTRAWTSRRARVRSVTASVLGYTPWARAALDYEVIAESGGLPELRRLVGKMHAMKPAARRFADAWAVWRAAGSRIGLAPPAGYIGSLGLTLQDRVRGVRLGGLVNTGRFPAIVRRTARMLAGLHALPLPLSTRRTPADEAATVHRWAALLVTIRPDLADRVERLRDWIAAELESRAVVRGPVHGDFHHTNVLVDGDTTTLIDFDEMAGGDPLVDVGRFLASLRIPALRAHGRIDGLQEAGHGFLDAYLRKSPQDLSCVRLFEAAALFIAAASAFRIQRPNWMEETDQLFMEAERVAATARARASLRLADAGRTVPPVTDSRRWVDDAVFMQASLDQPVRDLYDVELVACRTSRPRKTPDGLRVKLALTGWRGNAEWRRTLHGAPIERGGHGLMRRVRALGKALEETGRAPLLPTPVAYLKSLQLMVWDLPEGTPLAALLLERHHDVPAVVDEVARTLAVLHRTPVELDSRVSVDHELAAIRRAVDRSQELSEPQRRHARALSAAATEACLAAPIAEGPSLRRLAPRDVLWSGGRVALRQVDRMTLSQPLLDVGDLLARLTLLGLEHPERPHIQTAGDRFRSAYRAAARIGRDDLAGFEAGALLRLASIRARSEDDAELSTRLIEEADERLASTRHRVPA